MRINLPSRRKQYFQLEKQDEEFIESEKRNSRGTELLQIFASHDRFTHSSVITRNERMANMRK